MADRFSELTEVPSGVVTLDDFQWWYYVFKLELSGRYQERFFLTIDGLEGSGPIIPAAGTDIYLCEVFVSDYGDDRSFNQVRNSGFMWRDDSGFTPSPDTRQYSFQLYYDAVGGHYVLLFKHLGGEFDTDKQTGGEKTILWVHIVAGQE